MVWVPEVSAAVVQDASPVVGSTGAGEPQPVMAFLPSRKVTDPESLTVPVKGVSAAVKVTGAVMMDGFAELVSASPVVAWLTVCVSEALLVAKLGSPL